MKAAPTVRLDPRAPQPRLDWYPIIRYTKPAGELLAAFELILVSDSVVSIWLNNKLTTYVVCMNVGEW